MLLRTAGKWHNSSSLVVSREGDAYRLRVGFDGIAGHGHRQSSNRTGTYFEIKAEGLYGDGCDAVEQWTFANVPVNIHANIGGWLNVAWDDAVAVALVALDEKTSQAARPYSRTALRKLGP